MISIIVTIVFIVVMFFAMLSISKYYNENLIDLNTEEKDFLKKAFCTYLIYGLAQQLLVIEGFYFLCKMLPLHWAIVIASFLFMIFHYPNIVLMLAVFGMELFLLTIYSHSGYYYIPAMALTHSVLATCLLKFFPESIHKNFLVLWYFFNHYKNKGK